MSKTETVSHAQSELRNRGHKKGGENAVSHLGSMRSAEEILIEKLDAFLSSIEQRLEQFDQYFKLSGDTVIADEHEKYEKGEIKESLENKSHSRRSSSASLSSLKSFSMYNLNKIYEHLSMVKDQVLKTSVLNLEYLYTTLDEKYNYLFNQEGESDSDIDGDNSPCGDNTQTEDSTQCGDILTGDLEIVTSYMDSLTSNKELLTNKIITNLTYFEQKLSHIDALIKSKTPQATANYDEDAKFNRYRFFNFNRALNAAQKGYIHYYQLPLLWRENRYIIHGYRFNLSHREMLRSILHFNHNETANIWTHILGAVTMCYLGLVHFPQTEVYSKNSNTANAMMAIFVLAAVECLISSVLWHTYSCFAQLKIRNRFACVDYTGITVLITCSVVTAEYCSLYRYPKLLFSFMAVSVTSGIAGFLFNWSPYFDRPDCRPLRIGFFISLAFLGGTTFLCKWYYEGLVTAVYFYIPLVYKSFVWYWLGVVFYGGLIPERWRYDIIVNEDDTCGHEHNVSDILTGNIEHSGEEEFRELQASMAQKCTSHKMHGCASDNSPTPADSSCCTTSTQSPCSCTQGSGTQDSCTQGFSSMRDDDTMQRNDILRKHFPDLPMRTPYHDDFLSLWWVDYIFQSHNIWHVCVVLGVLGHYFCLLGMFEGIHVLESVDLAGSAMSS